MPRYVFLLLAAVALSLPGAAPAHDDLAFRELGRQLGEVEDAVRDVEAIRKDAVRKQEVDRLRCVEDRLTWLRGLELAGRTAIDEYAVAEIDGDDAAMAASVVKMRQTWEAAPRYTAEARLCGTDDEGLLADHRCSTGTAAPGQPCTKWTVTKPKRRGGGTFGRPDGGTTVPGRAAPPR